MPTSRPYRHRGHRKTKRRNSTKQHTAMEESKPLTKFTCFSKLPPELRSMIWDFSIAEIPGQLIEICETSKEHKHFSRTPAPILMHTCIESRNLMLKRWNWRILGQQHPDAENPYDFFTKNPALQPPNPCPVEKSKRPAIIFNLDKDTLYFNSEFKDYRAFMGNISYAELMPITRVAVPRELEFRMPERGGVFTVMLWLWRETGTLTIYDTKGDINNLVHTSNWNFDKIQELGFCGRTEWTMDQGVRNFKIFG